MMKKNYRLLNRSEPELERELEPEPYQNFHPEAGEELQIIYFCLNRRTNKNRGDSE
jgi:hypothetical protein